VGKPAHWGWRLIRRDRASSARSSRAGLRDRVVQRRGTGGSHDGKGSDLTDGALWFSNGTTSIGEITTSGVVTLHRAAGTRPLAGQITANQSNELWFTNYGNNMMGDARVA
jgi:hypothetical protein